jgi:ligand-binding SRPBCC domain-containing protein
MHEVVFRSELWLPRPREEVFNFFGDALNLQAITPEFLNFVVLTPAPIVMRAGTLIDYKLRVRGIPLRWRTLISAWEPPFRFMDEQLRGPYRQWIHEHTFEECDGGTLARDVVRYSVFGGALVDRLFVRRDVEKIFAYREKRLKELLGPVPNRSAYK